jgi:hypothetical protein
VSFHSITTPSVFSAVLEEEELWPQPSLTRRQRLERLASSVCGRR